MSNEEIKIALLGDTKVGKTSIISRYMEDSFNENYLPTFGAHYSEKIIKINDTEVQLNLWDISGQKKFRSKIKNFYKDVYFVCLVYDITNLNSFNNLKNIWYQDLKDYGEKYTILAVFGNKQDLDKDEEVNEQDARDFAEEINAFFMLTSAKNNARIDDLFETLAKEYFNPKFTSSVIEMEKKSSQFVTLNDVENDGCCKKICC